MISFDIQPFQGAAPLNFGMSRGLVRELLGTPELSDEQADRWGPFFEIGVGYDPSNLVKELAFGPGGYGLKFMGQSIWTPDDHDDPNPFFLTLDGNPVEDVGFLFFENLGVATSGYHDDDPPERSIHVYPAGELGKDYHKQRTPDLSKYM